MIMRARRAGVHQVHRLKNGPTTADLGDDLVHESAPDVDAPRAGAAEVARELLEGRRGPTGVGLEHVKKRLALSLRRAATSSLRPFVLLSCRRAASSPGERVLELIDGSGHALDDRIAHPRLETARTSPAPSPRHLSRAPDRPGHVGWPDPPSAADPLERLPHGPCHESIRFVATGSPPRSLRTAGQHSLRDPCRRSPTWPTGAAVHPRSPRERGLRGTHRPARRWCPVEPGG